MNRFTTFLLALGWAGAALAQNSKVSHEFGNTNSGGTVDIIVKFKSDPSDDVRDERHQKVVRRGGQYKSTHHIIRSASYRLNANQLADLASDPEVESISPDHPIHSMGVLTSGEGSQTNNGSSSSIMTSGAFSRRSSLQV
jgi:hypothetical protein